MVSTVCTTIKVCLGRPEFWTLHKARLQHFADILNRSLDTVRLDREITRRSLILNHGAIRIELGSDGELRFIPRTLPLNHSLKWCVAYSDRPRSQAAIKWFDRSNWNALKKQSNVDVLLLLDEYSRYLECCIGNIFVYRPREQQWYTPQVSLPLLPGIMRSVLLSNALSVGEYIVEGSLKYEHTDELWMGNALRGLCPLNGNGDIPPWACVESDVVNEARALEHFSQALSHL